jgi:hypothetical protein
MTNIIYIIIKLCAMKTKIKILHRTTMMLLILILPACIYASTPVSAQSDDGSTSSASQDYQEFQSCLSDAEADGYATEQQIRDCFAPIYNTGTTTAGTSPSDTSSGSEDASSPSASGDNNADTSDDGNEN